MTLNCDRLITTLPQMKWTEPIFGMVTRLLQDCIHYMAQNFNQILNSESFLALGKVSTAFTNKQLSSFTKMNSNTL